MSLNCLWTTPLPQKIDQLNIRTALTSILLSFTLGVIAVSPVRAQQGKTPNIAYSADKIFTQISPQLNNEAHNQPSVLNGYVVLAGNGVFRFYDISDPTRPQMIGGAKSGNVKSGGEAESHSISYAKVNGKLLAATVSGYGIDIWDWTDMRNPRVLSTVKIPGVNHGDFTEAVWGVAWQAPYIYVGATNNGLVVVDASDLANPKIAKRVPTSQLGGVSAGPLYALGTLLLVTTPKSSSGIATLDISNPTNPTIIDVQKYPQKRAAEESYIGSYHKGMAYLTQPLRIYDIVSEPGKIKQVKSLKAPLFVEYFSFQNDVMFLGEPANADHAGRDGGVYMFDHGGLNLRLLKHKKSRKKGMDDEFTIAVGNLLVVSDDEANHGSFLMPHRTEPDSTAPSVHNILPKDKSTSVAVTSSIGITFDESIELASLDTSSLIVRPVGGEPISGNFSNQLQIISFTPDKPLSPNTTYEVVLPSGGIKDYVGNGIQSTFRSVFSTGSSIGNVPSEPPAGGSARITLHTGWNIMSLPVQPSNTAPSAVLSAIAGKYQAVYAFDGESYQTYIPGESGNDLTRIEAGRGYWIYMDSSATLNVSGSAPSKSINLKAGWNLAGYNSTSATSTRNAVGSLGSDVVVYSFNPVTNEYLGYAPPDLNTLTNLEPGKGYWIYIPTNARWTLP